MNNLLKYSFLPFALMFFTLLAQAQVKPSKEERQAARQLARVQRQQQRQADWERKHAPSERDVVYIFGVGTNFNDSTVYVTTVQPIPYLRVTKKYKFLPYRADFSEQLKDYLCEHYKLSHETTCVFYSTKHSTLQKRLNKLKRRYLNMGTNRLVVVTQEEFRFEKPEYEALAF